MRLLKKPRKIEVSLKIGFQLLQPFFSVRVRRLARNHAHYVHWLYPAQLISCWMRLRIR